MGLPKIVLPFIMNFLTHLAVALHVRMNVDENEVPEHHAYWSDHSGVWRCRRQGILAPSVRYHRMRRSYNGRSPRALA
jgi:hypothetical protein